MGASMRPRVFPAEDQWVIIARRLPQSSFNEAAGIPRGRLEVVVRARHGRGASMRPRVFPAEDAALRPDTGAIPQVASMRPRVFPAEDLSCRPPSPRCWPSFNEAAGIPRGRLRGQCLGSVSRLPASMRPRVFPAEDARGRRRLVLPQRVRFNEAAGIPRGRHAYVQLQRRRIMGGFNEAAGIPRGRPDAAAHLIPGRRASMRPRVFPAEDRGRARRSSAGTTGLQ